MRKSRCTNEQVAYALRQAESREMRGRFGVQGQNLSPENWKGTVRKS